MNPCHSRAPTALDCASCPPHRVNLVHDLSDKEGARLIQFFRLRTYAARETIHCEGDLGTHVAVIRSGLVKLMLYSPSGRERIVRLAMPGDTIGLESILGGRMNHNAVALTTAQLCCIPRDIVDRRANDQPEFARRLMAEWNASVEDAERFLTDLSTGTAHERVARLLLYLQERVRIGPCPEITREDMAALLGITMETTSHVSAEFKRDGHLREDAQGHWHCRRAGLAVIAGGSGAEGKSEARFTAKRHGNRGAVSRQKEIDMKRKWISCIAAAALVGATATYAKGPGGGGSGGGPGAAGMQSRDMQQDRTQERAQVPKAPGGGSAQGAQKQQQTREQEQERTQQRSPVPQSQEQIRQQQK